MQPQIKDNLFDLTKEQEKTSKDIYDGKVVKCLIAPFHTYAQLEKLVPFTKTTYLFPERELSANRLTGVLSMIVKSPLKDEFRIVTTNQSIILDMVDDCVRILTEKGEIVPCPVKTFMANIHTIKYEIFDNEAFRISKKEQSAMQNSINKLITEIRGAKSFTKNKREELVKRASMIGEPIVSGKLLEMIDNVKPAK